MDERDPRVEVRPQAVDERQGEGDLRDEDEGRPAGFEGRRDRLDVDRRLAAAGHAIEQERARVARRDGRPDPLDRLGLGREQVAGRRAAAAPPGRSCRERPPGPLPDVGLGETAPDQARDRAVAVVTGKVRAGAPRRPGSRPARRGRPPGAGPAAGPAGRSPAATARPASVSRIQRS